MFYLNKRIGDLVYDISTVRFKKAEEPVRLKLGLMVGFSDYRNPIEQSFGAIPRAVTKIGNKYAYIVANGIGLIAGSEEKLAEQVKGAVIETLSKLEGEMGVGLLARAGELAYMELIKSMCRERAKYIAYLIAHDTVGYGPMSILMEDKEHIEGIEITAPCKPVSVFHVSYGRCITNLRFRSVEQFKHSLDKFVYETDKEQGDGSPMIDTQVEDAHTRRQIRPYILNGTVASIMLAKNKVVGVDYLAKKGTVNFDVLAYLWMAMDAGKNIVIAGEPASGRTTLLGALFSFIPRIDRIVSVEEDINELKMKIDINNTVALYSSRYGNSTSIRERVLNALIMRPDRLVVDEVRGEETRELFSGASVGIPFITTMHSNPGGVEMIKTLVAKPMYVETRSLGMLDLSIYIKQLGLSNGLLSDIYEYKWLSRAETDRWEAEIDESEAVEISNIVSDGRLDSGLLVNSKIMGAFSKKKGMDMRNAITELTKRTEFLRAMCESGKSENAMLEEIQGYGW